MKLVELVNYFRNSGSYEEFCQSNSLDIDSEVIEIYMEKPFHLNNELSFFEIEKTQGSIEMTLGEITYFNLFDFYYFLDAIEESKNGEYKSMSDNEISAKLLSFANKDA